MPISASTLSALQKVGAAAFNADEKLKKEVGLYAQRVNTAIFSNPYHLGNDALIESWKVVARLSKTLAGIEEELRNLYRVASELAEDDQPSVRETRVLAAPTPAPTATKPAVQKSTNQAVDLTATTVKVKKPAKKPIAKPAPVATTAAKTTASTTPKATATKPSQANKTPAKPQPAKQAAVPAVVPAKSAKKASVSPVKAAAPAPAKAKPVVPAKKTHATSAVAPTQVLAGNPAKLLAYLQTILKTEAFEHINQTALYKSTGIPLGSIGATLGRLTKAGRLVAGPQGSYKLAS